MRIDNVFILLCIQVMYPDSIFPVRNFNMSPISRTLKTSGSCLWCLEMNFISIFDSFRALASASKSSYLPRRKESVPYISEPILYSLSRSFFSICKAFQSYNFTKTLKTLQTFPRKPRVGNAKEKKKEINCQLLRIILIMLILFLLHHSLYALCLHHS